MKKILTTFFAIMLLFTAIFSVGCSSNDNFEKREKAKYIFENELPKIEVEVEGYYLVTTHNPRHLDKYGFAEKIMFWVDYNPKNVENDGHTYIKITSQDNREKTICSEDFLGKSETYDKLYNLYSEVDDGTLEFYCVQFVDDKMFVMANGTGEVSTWPNMYFIYDFYNDTLKYCGYAEEEKYPYYDLYYGYYMPTVNRYRIKAIENSD